MESVSTAYVSSNVPSLTDATHRTSRDHQQFIPLAARASASLSGSDTGVLPCCATHPASYPQHADPQQISLGCRASSTRIAPACFTLPAPLTTSCWEPQSHAAGTSRCAPGPPASSGALLLACNFSSFAASRLVCASAALAAACHPRTPLSAHERRASSKATHGPSAGQSTPPPTTPNRNDTLDKKE